MTIQKYISLVGIERAGKGTVLASLNNDLSLSGFKFVREPGSSPRARIFREILKPRETTTQDKALPETVLAALAESRISPEVYYHVMVAGRYDLFENLKDQPKILSDRGHLCTLAYQCFGQQLFHHIGDWQADYYRLFRDRNIDDLHIFLDITPEESINRRSGRASNDPFDEAELGFYTRVREGYLHGLNFVNTTSSKTRTAIVSGAQKEDVVFEQVKQLILDHLNK